MFSENGRKASPHATDADAAVQQGVGKATARLDHYNVPLQSCARRGLTDVHSPGVHAESTGEGEQSADRKSYQEVYSNVRLCHFTSQATAVVVSDSWGHETVREPTTETTVADCTAGGSDCEDIFPKKTINRRRRLIGSPADVALLNYVEAVASIEGIRDRFQVR